MLTPEDLIQIKMVVREIVEDIVEQKLEEKLEKKLKPIRSRLTKIEREVKLIHETLNYTIEHFGQRHTASNKRFERLETYLGIYNTADPLILRDGPTQKSLNS
jgi:hypothetical protein